MQRTVCDSHSRDSRGRTDPLAKEVTRFEADPSLFLEVAKSKPLGFRVQFWLANPASQVCMCTTPARGSACNAAEEAEGRGQSSRNTRWGRICLQVLWGSMGLHETPKRPTTSFWPGRGFLLDGKQRHRLRGSCPPPLGCRRHFHAACKATGAPPYAQDLNPHPSVVTPPAFLISPGKPCPSANALGGGKSLSGC